MDFSIMLDLMWFGIVKVYHYIYLHNPAYENFGRDYVKCLRLCESVVRDFAFWSVSFVGCLLYFVVLWVR